MREVNLYNIDCVEFMKGKPDKWYDVAIVDPPYGGGAKQGKFKLSRTGGTWSTKYQSEQETIRKWDIAPTQEYFDELFRVSKNQIIFGGNYFDLPPFRCFIVWDKPNITETWTMSMCEMAWTSFNMNAKFYRHVSCNPANDKRIHPTQKPVGLYEFVIRNFCKQGDRLLDTNGGSMSSAIAAYKLGFDIDVCEINKSFFTKAKERVEAYIKKNPFLL